MFRLTVVVRPQRAEVLCQRLLASGLVDDLTAVECRGYGRQKGHLDTYKDAEYTIDVLPKVTIEGSCAEDARQRVVEIILSTCRTGRIGDGKVFLVPILDSVEVIDPASHVGLI